MSNADYIAFFLTAPASVVQLELVEISHPDFSQVYRFVRNSRAGVTVTLPDLGSTAFDYRPIRIQKGGDSDNLAQSMRLDVGDPGEVLANEEANLISADSFLTKPKLRYWAYRSDDLTSPLVGPLVYDVVSLSKAGPAVSIEAQAPEKNANGTGERYSFDRFGMLRGYL